MTDDHHDDLDFGDLNFGDLGGQDWQQLEAAILAAGEYVRPSQDLRPRVLDAARQQADDRSGQRRVATLAIAALLLVTISTALLDTAGRWCVQRTSPSATEMQLRATRIDQPEQAAAQWGLVEAFAQLRRFQADRVGIADTRIK